MILRSLLNPTKSFRNVVKQSCTIALVALCALTIGDAAFSQPPGAPGQSQQGSRGGHGSRGGRGGSQEQSAQNGGDQKGGPQGNAQQQGAPKDASKDVAFDDMIKKVGPATPIQLNQREFVMNGVSGVYYKGKCDESTPVVILIRDVSGKREDFDALAQTLAGQLGCAVLIPELRGQGGPNQGPQGMPGQGGPNQGGPNQGGPNQGPNQGPQGMPGQGGPDMGALDMSGMGAVLAQPQPPQNAGQGGKQGNQLNAMTISQMINDDYYFWFNTFLRYIHNQKYCNIKKTILVGSGFGAALAAAWARNDWEAKEGVSQNVVGVALLSPDASNDSGKYNALSSLEALHKRAKGANMGYLIFVGKLDEDKFADAQEIQKKVGGKVADEKTPMEDRPCVLVAIQSEKQANDLFHFESFGVPTTIVQWVNLRMTKLPKKRNKWEEIVEKKSRRG